VSQQITDCPAQSGVGFRPPLRQLRFQPQVQLVHYRRAAFLVKPQPLIRRQAPILCIGIVAIHHVEHLQQVAAFAREVLRHVYKLSSSMCEAVGQKDLSPGGESRDVAR
jgi:hypothetical protein